jgi:hypothetical protein
MGLRALVSSQNEPGCLDPPHPVSSLAHDRGTTVHDRSPHTCLRLEHPFSREGVIPFPGLGGNAAASISAARFSMGCVVQTHLDLHDLAPSFAGREHDAPNRMLQSTNRNVPSRVARCARFGRAGPRRRIRRAPRRTPSRIIEWDHALATPASAHCGWTLTVRMTPSSAATRPSSSPKNCPDDGRSIRPPGTPLTYPRKTDLQRRGAGSPLVTFFACWTEKVGSRHRS